MKTDELLKEARSMEKGTSREFIHLIFSDFMELHGDRLFGDDEAIIGGIGFLDDLPVTVIGQQKGKNLKENLQTNFGQAHPEGYRKALRLMKQAEKFKRPIVTFINTAGAFCGIGAEERGQGAAIADCLTFLSTCRVPVIAIILGEGGSGGALALALSDEVWMLEQTFYAILSPEGFASILFKDAKKATKAADLMKLSPKELKEQGVIDDIISEIEDQKRRTTGEIATELKTKLKATFKRLNQEDPFQRMEKRYERFRQF